MWALGRYWCSYTFMKFISNNFRISSPSRILAPSRRRQLRITCHQCRGRDKHCTVLHGHPSSIPIHLISLKFEYLYCFIYCLETTWERCGTNVEYYILHESRWVVVYIVHKFLTCPAHFVQVVRVYQTLRWFLLCGTVQRRSQAASIAMNQLEVNLPFTDSSTTGSGRN